MAKNIKKIDPVLSLDNEIDEILAGEGIDATAQEVEDETPPELKLETPNIEEPEAAPEMTEYERQMINALNNQLEEPAESLEQLDLGNIKIEGIAYRHYASRPLSVDTPTWDSPGRLIPSPTTNQVWNKVPGVANTAYAHVLFIDLQKNQRNAIIVRNSIEKSLYIPK